MSGGTDPLSTLVSGISFSDLETDVVSVGVTLAALYVVFVGVKWILHMVKRA